MGGKLLADYGSRPLRSDEAETVGTSFMGAIRMTLGRHRAEGRIRMLKSYADKQIFGDVDLMLTKSSLEKISLPQLKQDLSQFMGADLIVEQPNKNADMFSIGFPVGNDMIQVDVLLIEDQSFDFSSGFLDYNGLGKLINLVAKDLGKLKLGRNGLSIVVKEAGIYLGEVVLTRDFNKALRFLGYNAAQYRKGFKTKLQVFEFAASSANFCREVFRPENRNTKASADTRRPFYQDFLAWMDTQELPESRTDDTNWVEKALDNFPNARVQMADMIANHHEKLDLKKDIKARFNGGMVSQLTGLKGEDLGKFIESFQLKVAGGDLDGYVMKTDQPGIKKAIGYHFSQRDTQHEGP